MIGVLVKYIWCEVEEEKRSAFSKAQEEWDHLAEVEGFLGQFGGWGESGEAVILGFWESRQAYQHFMEYVHDTIFLENNQGKTYRSITVTLYEGEVFKQEWLENSESGGRLYLSGKPNEESAVTFLSEMRESLSVAFSEMEGASVIDLEPKWNVMKKGEN
ncbi:YdbC family protein [Bacillus haimaensis]|uniref:YdbC family protein n=1 Tax=Bacillus haimaensis TaxID=3160967 RepID=UPI003AA7DD55